MVGKKYWYQYFSATITYRYIMYFFRTFKKSTAPYKVHNMDLRYIITIFVYVGLPLAFCMRKAALWRQHCIGGRTSVKTQNEGDVLNCVNACNLYTNPSTLLSERSDLWVVVPLKNDDASAALLLGLFTTSWAFLRLHHIRRADHKKRSVAPWEKEYFTTMQQAGFFLVSTVCTQISNPLRFYGAKT